MKVHKVVMVRNIVICWSLSSQVLLSLASALTLHNVHCRLSKNHVALPFAALALLPFAAISLYIYMYICVHVPCRLQRLRSIAYRDIVRQCGTSNSVAQRASVTYCGVLFAALAL